MKCSLDAKLHILSRYRKVRKGTSASTGDGRVESY
ncbi:hypothetical protein N7507_011761 [Penicillium longicatenatum]|nr:hypothetical protein N7507_011761 [Penicillium longicatenatum]